MIRDTQELHEQNNSRISYRDNYKFLIFEINRAHQKFFFELLKKSSKHKIAIASAGAGLVDAPDQPRLELSQLVTQLIDALSHPHLHISVPSRFCEIEVRTCVNIIMMIARFQGNKIN